MPIKIPASDPDMVVAHRAELPDRDEIISLGNSPFGSQDVQHNLNPRAAYDLLLSRELAQIEIFRDDDKALALGEMRRVEDLSGGVGVH